MFFITQLKILNDYFIQDNYFYDVGALNKTFAEIAGASNYNVARARFAMTCEDLQTVLKFVLGFLDYDAFKVMDKEKDASQFKLINKPLVAESVLQNTTLGMSNKLVLFFTAPPEGESVAEARERQYQLMMIHRFIDLEKFKVSAAKLTGKGKYPRNLQFKQNFTKVCADIVFAFSFLNDMRRFLIIKDTPTPELISVDRQFVETVVTTKAALVASLAELQGCVDLLKTNLQDDSYSIAMPGYDNHCGYLRKAHTITEDVPEYMRLLSIKFPDKKIMYVASDQLNKNNHFNLIRELNQVYAEQLKFIVAFPFITERYTDKSALDKQRNKNIARFNAAFGKSLAKFHKALQAFDKALPISFKVEKNCMTDKEDVSDLAIVNSDLTAADMPEYGSVKVILVNQDQVVLAHAEIAFMLVTFQEYLKNVNKAFKRIKVVTKDDIDYALTQTNKSRIALQESYQNVLLIIQGNTFSIEKNHALIEVKTLIMQEIILAILRITNKVFEIQNNDHINIKAALKKIATVNKRIAHTNGKLSEFSDYLAEMMRVGFAIFERYHKLSGALRSAGAFLNKLKQTYPEMSAEMLDKTQELTRLLDDANQYLTACPPVNDSNVFGELAKCLEQIHVKVYQVHGMVDEIKTLAPKLNTINVRVNIDSFKLECHSVNRHRFLSSPLTTPSKPEEVEVKRLRI